MTNITSANLLHRAQAISEQLVAWRRDIHMHPELGFEEQRTARLVADPLADMGLDVQARVGNTCHVGLLSQR